MSCGEYLLIMVGWVAPSALDADRLDCGCQGIHYARWAHKAGIGVGECAPIFCHGGMGSPFSVYCRHFGCPYDIVWSCAEL